MTYFCSKCETELKFSNDKTAEMSGHKIICYKMPENIRIITCVSCLYLIRDAELAKKPKGKITPRKINIDMNRIDIKPTKLTKNQSMFEEIPGY